MSEQSIVKNNHELISSREAAKLFGVTHDYISRLCRKGQLVGTSDGGRWMVERQSLDAVAIVIGIQRRANHMWAQRIYT